jgi:hypothetical protein
LRPFAAPSVAAAHPLLAVRTSWHLLQPHPAAASACSSAAAPLLLPLKPGWSPGQTCRLPCAPPRRQSPQCACSKAPSYVSMSALPMSASCSLTQQLYSSIMLLQLLALVIPQLSAWLPGCLAPGCAHHRDHRISAASAQQNALQPATAAKSAWPDIRPCTPADAAVGR